MLSREWLRFFSDLKPTQRTQPTFWRELTDKLQQLTKLDAFIYKTAQNQLKIQITYKLKKQIHHAQDKAYN